MDTEAPNGLSPRSAQLLFDAARDLLAEKSASELTVREIAARAGVQHTLIARHFGSRDALLALVVSETLARFAVAVETAPDLAAAVRTGLDQFSSNRALASGMAILVVGEGVGALGRYPLADAYEAQLVAAGVEAGRARDTAVCIISLLSSWAIGADFWLGMAGRSGDPRRGRDLVEPAVWAVVDQAKHPRDEPTGSTDP